ncbi:MAG TPA: FoF1 ATP synthase subunit gamma [Planctomycetaceae bacterium]|nr:FoF1 ATP synthase subunit gamma [Planctomycetaceae bacterium]
MKRELDFARRLQTLEALHDAVSAMRSLSAHHFRVVRGSLPPAREYRKEIDRIVDAIGIHQASNPSAPTGLLAVTSDFGLCSDYNTAIAQTCLKQAQERGAVSVYCIGRRGRNVLAKSEREPKQTFDAPTSADGITRALMKLARDLLNDFVTGQISSLWVVSARFDGVGHFTPVTNRVLPVTSKSPLSGPPPSRYIDPRYLEAVAVREFLYVTLYEILLEALAAEHGMRIVAAESALQWLDGTITLTKRLLTSSRSETSTQELLDIVSGRRTTQSP